MTKFLNIVLILMFLNSYDMRNVIFKELKTSQDIEIIKNDQTGIPDIALYQCVLEKADKNMDQIVTKEEGNKLTELDCSNVYSDVSITNVKGIAISVIQRN